ncbi:MAG: deoxyguanosinetriphosphate triphosphohydrolase [Microbacteriaceae bacterium]|nr:deoxyguanosinetriphosphate triphosphohydrolase [Microbacteriaceae bacterium]
MRKDYKLGYSDVDLERFMPETHSGPRGDFTRDRARMIHSSAWRRLSGKTQVLSPVAEVDFPRNRLTHSLEVAQIGRELAISFKVSADLVDAACLAHDLGHPPFGHNGEEALNAWAQDAGGFEGNAQTLRLLTFLEPKHTTPAGQSVGLNLTRATLDASCKYPWPRLDEKTGLPRRKFGYFAEDSEVFTWLRQGAVPGKKCFEAQLMDLSDDIAYSVHDFEDAIVGEYIDPLILTSRAAHDSILAQTAQWHDGAFSIDELGAAFERIAADPAWLRQWSGSRADHAALKNFTSAMIGRFARAAIAATREAFAQGSLVRYNADVILPAEIAAEIAFLKGVVGAYVMRSNLRQPVYQAQRDLLSRLCDALWRDPSLLEPIFLADFKAAGSTARAKRAIVDQVACLTDKTALAWDKKLTSVRLV